MQEPTTFNMVSRLKLISNSVIESTLTYKELVPAIEKCLANFSAGKVVQPLRSVVPVEPHNGLLFSMCAHDTSEDVLALKNVALYPDNHKQGLSSHLTQVLYFQPSTGALLAVMDGESITAMRTAAASVVATKYLAKEDSKVLSILGAGVQAYSHAKALTSSFKFDKIFIWNRTQSTGEKFCEEIKHLAKVVKFCPSTKEAVCDADVIVTATFSSTPILHGQDLKESVHINSVGACTPHLRELDDRCMELCAVIADSRVSALAESGDIISAKKEVLCEVGNIINGEVEVNRTRRTLFKSLGIAVEDVTAANLVWEKVGKQQPVGF